MQSVLLAVVFLAMLFVPCLILLRFAAREQQSFSPSEFQKVKTWQQVARVEGRRHPLVTRVLSFASPASNVSGRWAGRSRKQWRTS